MTTDARATGRSAQVLGRLRWLEFRRPDEAREGLVTAPGGNRAPAVADQPARYPLTFQRTTQLVWLVLSDAAALCAAFASAYWIRFELEITTAPDVVASGERYATLAAGLVLLWQFVFFAVGLYRVHPRLTGPVESARAFRACTVAAMLVVFVHFLVPSFVISRGWLTSAWGLSFLFVSGNRFLSRRLVRAARRKGALLAPALIIGTNEEAASLEVFLRDWQSSGVRAIGFVAATGPSAAAPMRLPVIGSVGDIGNLVERYGIEEVIVAITSVNREELLGLCESLAACPVQLRLSSGLYELLTTRVSVQTLGTVPLMSLQKNRLSRREAVVKAVLDRSLALAGLAVLWPVMLGIALAIKLDSVGPVAYRRRVLGAGGRQFDALKFRTMAVNGDDLLSQQPVAAAELSVNHKLKEDPRVTKVGRWLRRYSLDELPQLLNVLVGQMALVGPRMITLPELEEYGRHRMNLLTVKPGITGLWQVSGRSDLTYEERVRLDMYYIRNYSLWLDLQILFIQTPPAVIRSRGAY